MTISQRKSMKPRIFCSAELSQEPGLSLKLNSERRSRLRERRIHYPQPIGALLGQVG